MATLIGTSGAMKDVKRESERWDCPFDGEPLEGLDRLRADKRTALSQAEARCRASYRDDLQTKLLEIDAAQRAASEEVALLRQGLEISSRALDEEVRVLGLTTSLARSLASRPRIWLRKLRRWRGQRRFEGRTRSLEDLLAAREEQVEQLERNIEINVARALQSQREDLLAVENLLAGPSVAGARAELAVIARLATLPEQFTLINDVRLRALRFARFRGTPLMCFGRSETDPPGRRETDPPQVHAAPYLFL